jgi:hypothetical protein
MLRVASAASLTSACARSAQVAGQVHGAGDGAGPLHGLLHRGLLGRRRGQHDLGHGALRVLLRGLEALVGVGAQEHALGHGAGLRGVLGRQREDRLGLAGQRARRAGRGLAQRVEAQAVALGGLLAQAHGDDERGLQVALRRHPGQLAVLAGRAEQIQRLAQGAAVGRVHGLGARGQGDALDPLGGLGGVQADNYGVRLAGGGSGQGDRGHR